MLLSPIFNTKLNTRTTTNTAFDSFTANKDLKTKTTVSKIIIRSKEIKPPLNFSSAARLTTVTTNALEQEKYSNARTPVPTKNPRMPMTYLQVGKYYQTEKNSINRASRLKRSAGSVAPPKKTKSTRIF